MRNKEIVPFGQFGKLEGIILCERKKNTVPY